MRIVTRLSESEPGFTISLGEWHWQAPPCSKRHFSYMRNEGGNGNSVLSYETLSPAPIIVYKTGKNAQLQVYTCTYVNIIYKDTAIHKMYL